VTGGAKWRIVVTVAVVAVLVNVTSFLYSFATPVACPTPESITVLLAISFATSVMSAALLLKYLKRENRGWSPMTGLLLVLIVLSWAAALDFTVAIHGEACVVDELTVTLIAAGIDLPISGGAPGHLGRGATSVRSSISAARPRNT